MTIEERLEYLYKARRKVEEELASNPDKVDYPWTLETKKQMLNEEIHELLHKEDLK